MSLSLPGYQLMSPIAKIPGTLDSNAAVSTTIYSPSFISMPQSATGPSFMVNPKNGSSASQAISQFEPSLRFTLALPMCASSPERDEIWPTPKCILPAAAEPNQLVDAVGRGAKLAAPVHESEVTRNRRKVHRPIKRGI